MADDTAATDTDAFAWLQPLLGEQSTSRARLVQHAGQRYWLKRCGDKQSTVWHRLQGVLSRLIPYPILRPTAQVSGPIALAKEAQRLREWRQAGITVPRVFAQGEDWLLLEDIGDSLQSLFDTRRMESRDEPVLLELALQGLQDIHRNTLAHGRPSLKDMIWDGNRIGFLDLEESPLAQMALGPAQARDIWLFIISVSMAHHPDPNPYLPELCRQACAGLTSESRNELQRLLRVLNPLYTLLKPFEHTLGREVRGVLQAHPHFLQQFRSGSAD